MRVPVLLRLTEPDSVNDRSMVERVREHRVFWRQHGLEETGVGVEARPVEDRVFALVELS